MAATAIGGQSLHAADDRGRERGEQQRGPEHRADRQADDAGPQEHGQERRAPTRPSTRPRAPAARGCRAATARSASSAQARMAMPSAGARGTARARRTRRGITITAITSLPPNRNGSMVNDRLNGAGKLCGGTATSNQRGSRSPRPASTCARPMVATVRIRRGARKNRRITRNSTTARRARSRPPARW